MIAGPEKGGRDPEGQQEQQAQQGQHQEAAYSHPHHIVSLGQNRETDQGQPDRAGVPEAVERHCAHEGQREPPGPPSGPPLAPPLAHQAAGSAVHDRCRQAGQHSWRPRGADKEAVEHILRQGEPRTGGHTQQKGPGGRRTDPETRRSRPTRKRRARADLVRRG